MPLSFNIIFIGDSTDSNDNIKENETAQDRGDSETPLTVEDIAPEPAPVPAEEVAPVTRPQNSDDLASFILMWLLTFGIMFLVYRRLQRHFDLDLIELIDQYFSSLLPH